MNTTQLFHLVLVILCVIDGAYFYKHKYKKARLAARKQKLHKSNTRSTILQAFTPQQVHISYGKKPSDIIVMWATATTEPKMAVQYSYNTRISDLSVVVGEEMELHTMNEKGTKYWHRAYLQNLKPGTEYYYKIYSKENGVTSDMFKFTVPNVKYNNVHSYMVLADMGTITKTLKYIVHEALNGKYTSVFHIGDIAYDLHAFGGFIGDKYLNNIQPMTSCIPYLVSPGDHESANDFKHYRYRFSMQNSNWPMKSDKLFYSFNLGAAHFISLNTEVFFTKKTNTAAQLAWLEKDLKSVINKDNRPWIIVMGHRPLYSSCDRRQDCLTETSVMKKNLEDLFFKYGVDLYISGHYHNYERTWAVYKDKIVNKHYKNSRAPVYITVGSLGSVYLSERISASGGSWSAKHISDGKENYGVLDVINSTHLRWKLFAAVNNEKLDNIWMIQRNKYRFGDPRKYLESDGRNIAHELPPEPIIVVGKSDTRFPNFNKVYLRTRGVLFKDSGLIVALITMCSFVFLICIFYKRLWRR